MTTHLPFTARQARHLGITRAQRRRLLDSGGWSRIRRNAYVVTRYAEATPDLLLRAGAILPQLDGTTVISHESAAVLWRLPHLRPPTDDLQLSRARRCQGRTRYHDTVIHHAAVPRAHTSDLHGLPVTTMARTILDITRLRGMRAGLVIAEAAFARRDETGLCPVELAFTASECRGWPGIRTARWVAEHAGQSSESPLESLSRALFYRYALPIPRQQVVFGHDRVDFLWEAARLIGEADGLAKYELRPDARAAEQAREQRLAAQGFSVLRWGWNEAMTAPERLAATIQSALAARGHPVRDPHPQWLSGRRQWFLPAPPKRRRIHRLLGSG
ncbi:uncharacterized protein DUF559 [Stackebrandtia albiflava]|uniref:Uncharacterized protein DUF559 n=1 Tax=Stackebrandtia albiflava TaxID=406432 RepID=A0A562UY34_9ACTN|nr:DUF559 domain-containing protein [Stackebrandtia albiflava]TWJ10525.1 uncharacterized protein DUF559 [Stackebrandtia albiflava]